MSGRARMTLARARAILAKHGITISKRDGEYRVAFAGGLNEDTAYYTDNAEDAVETGLSMRAHGWPVTMATMSRDAANVRRRAMMRHATLLRARGVRPRRIRHLRAGEPFPDLGDED